MSERVYTTQEANELLVYLAPTLTELRDKFIRSSDLRAQVAREAAGNGASAKRSAGPGAQGGNRERLQRTQGRIAELIARIAEWEIELRDVEAGLVDFPAVVDGGPAWLCWKLGEPRVSYWHPRDSGFSDRRPL